MKMSVNAMKAYGLASLALAAGLFVSLTTSNWSWLSRSGSAVVVIGILLTSSQILEHSRRLKRRRPDWERRSSTLVKDGLIHTPQDFASEERLRSVAHASNYEENTWEIEGYGLHILILGTLVWGFGDLVGLMPFF